MHGYFYYHLKISYGICIKYIKDAYLREKIFLLYYSDSTEYPAHNYWTVQSCLPPDCPRIGQVLGTHAKNKINRPNVWTKPMQTEILHYL